MKIKKIRLNGFGIFSDAYDLKLDEKINIFIGPNESGKSTLIKGILAVIFGLKKNEWEKYRPWNISKDKYDGEIYFNINNNSYYIYREFETNKVILKENKEELFNGHAAPGGRTEEKEKYFNILKKIIGFGNKEVFYNTNVVLQKSIEANITSEIQSIITGATGSNYKVILDKWLYEYFNLTKESRWSFVKNKNKNRIIEEKENELRELEGRKSKLQENFIKASELENKLEILQKEFEEVKTKIDSKVKEYENINSYIQLLKEKKYINEKINNVNENLQKIENINRELEAKNNLIEKLYVNYDKISEENIRDYNLLIESKKELKEKEGSFEIIKHESLPSIKGSIILSINLFMFSALISVLGFKFKDKLFFYIGGGVFLLSLIYTIMVLVKRTREKIKYNTRYMTAENEFNRVKEQLHILNQRLEDVKSIIDEPDFLGKYRAYKEVMADVEKLKSNLEMLEDYEKLEEEKNKFISELNEIVSRLMTLEKENVGLKKVEEEFEKSVEYTSKLKQEIDELNIKKKELEENIFDIKNQLSELVTDEESLASIEYKIEDIEEALENLKFNRDVFALAVTKLDEAIKEYQEKHIDRVSASITEFFKAITNNKYDKVFLDDDFNPFINYKGVKINAAEDNTLSCGTEEQLFFAVRISLVKEINNVSYLPLILDDPFVNFDKNRLKIIKELLYKIAEQNQILLFTHSEEYADWKNCKIMQMK